MAKYIGKEISRVDGLAKVTGQAKYAAEFFLPKMVYGFIVQRAIAKGKIKSIDTKAAEKSAGVIKVFTHLNTPKIPVGENGRTRGRESFNPLQSDEIVFNNQPIALVVAETFEQARFAASLVKTTYAEEKPTTDTIGNLTKCDRIKCRKIRRNRAEIRKKLLPMRRQNRSRIYDSDRASQSDGTARRDRCLAGR